MGGGSFHRQGNRPHWIDLLAKLRRNDIIRALERDVPGER